jgi:hypothetical protein
MFLLLDVRNMERREWMYVGIIGLLASVLILQSGFFVPAEEAPPLTPPKTITETPVITVTEAPITTITGELPVVTTTLTTQESSLVIEPTTTYTTQLTTAVVTQSTIQPPPTTTPPVTSEPSLFPQEHYTWDVSGTWGTGSFIVRYRLDFLDENFKRIIPGTQLFIGGSTESEIYIPANAAFMIIMIEEIVIHVRDDPALLLEQTQLWHWLHIEVDSAFGGKIWAQWSGSTKHITDFSAFTITRLGTDLWQIRRTEWELDRDNLEWYTFLEQPFDGKVLLRSRIQLLGTAGDSGVYEHLVTLNYP